MPSLAAARVGLGVAWSLFQLYTAATGLFDLLIQLPIHVAFAVAVGFLTPVKDDRVAWWDGACALAALGSGAYYVIQHSRLVTRMALVDEPRAFDLLVGVVFLLQRIIRYRKRRSDPVNVADGKPSVPSVDGRAENDNKAERQD